MNIKIDNIKVRISKNENNRFWDPIGQFWNITEILINGEWYKCGMRFIIKENKYYIQFFHPMKVEEKTNHIKKVFCEGVYKEVETSSLKFNLLKYLQNTHEINSTSFEFRKSIFDKKRTILIFSIALIPSILFYIINAKYDNVIINLIAENIWVQTFFFFLTISGFISIFHPFSIRKEIGEEDIKNIIKQTQEEDRINEEIKRNSSF